MIVHLPLVWFVNQSAPPRPRPLSRLLLPPRPLPPPPPPLPRLRLPPHKVKKQKAGQDEKMK